MKKLFLFALFGFVAVALTVAPEFAMADAGATLLGDLNTALGGSLGTIAGLIIAVLGLYMWLVQQASWGIVMIIGGVLITVFPQLFDSIKGGVDAGLTDITVAAP